MELVMDRAFHRKTDPLNANYSKTPRLICNSQGIFYKVRGGRLNGPFKSEVEAKNDLDVFIKVIAIEEQLDTENLHIFSRR